MELKEQVFGDLLINNHLNIITFSTVNFIGLKSYKYYNKEAIR